MEQQPGPLGLSSTAKRRLRRQKLSAAAEAKKPKEGYNKAYELKLRERAIKKAANQARKCFDRSLLLHKEGASLLA